MLLGGSGLVSLEPFVCGLMGASGVLSVEPVQSLWGGYGQLLRVGLVGGDVPGVVVKWIKPPTTQQHPRGWNTSRSYERKLRSYEVECSWYTRWSERCVEACRVPRCYAVEGSLVGGEGLCVVMEDLDLAGFDVRCDSLSPQEAALPLGWLAWFHACFMGAAPDGLWPVGSYWHLETRPDEWEAMAPGPLKEAAAAIDQRLRQASYQTLIHGDAKVANFCFDRGMERVAAVDFQYLGGGCGVKDVAYLLGSCLTSDQLEAWADQLWDVYFASLKEALLAQEGDWKPEAIEAEWRQLVPLAWADFHRFLLGWMPTHQKIHRYSEAMVEAALCQQSQVVG